MNLVILSGRLGHDPEEIMNGVKFSLALKDSGEVTTWVRVIVFEKQAELCKQFLLKGSEVLVNGRLSFLKDPMTGQLKTSVIAHRVEFMGSKPHPESDA